MLPAFAEAERSTTQPCTLLLLVPPVVMAVITRGRWAPFAAMCIGAVLGGWLFIANVVALSPAQLQLGGITAYMLGALVPVLAAVLVIRAIDPSATAARRASWVAGGIGIVTAGALLIGRHDDLVGALTRWSTS